MTALEAARDFVHRASRAFSLWRDPTAVIDTEARDMGRTKALDLLARDADTRWTQARTDKLPSDTWTSFDRMPWRHPWLTDTNIQAFASFSARVLDSLPQAPASAPASYGFVGNLANINYLRLCGLRRLGMDISLHLHPDDRSLMSQPFWEDFDGQLDELGQNPDVSAFDAKLPDFVVRRQHDPGWVGHFRSQFPSFVRPADVAAWPEFMGYEPSLEALQRHDALLVSQAFYLGPLSGKPFVIAQSGGDIWFDPARDDRFGRLVMRALRESHAVLVSNPITLAHARRYGLKNCLYLPFILDEERYRPGSEPGIRDEWKRQTGGEFFVLTSMRLDNAWKGADVAIEGFARFAAREPSARLVVLGWGTDRQATMERLAELGLADRVLLLPIVGKRRLARYIRAADVLLEQFALGYYGASGLEAMASGVPVVMRVERAQYEALMGRPPPVLDASTPADVCERLSGLAEDEGMRQAIGTATRDWFMATHSALAWKERYDRLLWAVACRRRVPWHESPLSSPLGLDEAEWHASQLAGAPPFPQYVI